MSGQLAEVKRLPLDRAQPSDAELARQVMAGQPSAQALVWDRYSALVRGILRKSFGPAVDVDDLVQDTFIRFFSSVKGLRDPEALRSFLIGVAMRVAATELRRRRVRRWLRLSDSGALPEAAGDELDEESREALRRLYALLDELDDPSRLAFVLRFVEGLELDDVAAGLGVSLATAKRKLAKVRAVVMARVLRDPVLSTYGTELIARSERGGGPS
jgi:RNA polymerase sigma-70 factor (ECF subfamily)